jgi:hypothetical protein
MNISKSDFKIIFNKMTKTDSRNVNNYIKRLNITGKTGDNNIDKIIQNYNPNYILSVMNKINNKVLLGGNQPQTQQFSDTSTEANNHQHSKTLSDTSIDASNQPQSRQSSDTSINASNQYQTQQFSDTSISNLDYTDTDESKEDTSSIKMSIKELLIKLKTKSNLLKKKDLELEEKETYLNKRQQTLLKLETDTNNTLKELGKDIDVLNKQKEELVSEVQKLRMLGDKIKDNISEIDLDFNNRYLTETDSETDSGSINELLKKLFK